MIVPVGTWEGLRKCQPKSVGQTNFCGSKNACTLAGENACVFRLPVTKMGLLAEILSRFRSTNPEKALKYAKNKNFFQKQGQKKTDFYDIYTVGFPTHFLKGADFYVNKTNKRSTLLILLKKAKRCAVPN